MLESMWNISSGGGGSDDGMRKWHVWKEEASETSVTFHDKIDLQEMITHIFSFL